jgi:hypothetical protein
MRIPRSWLSLVFIIIPVFIITVDAVVLVRERRQPRSQKAIRLVKESNSRKENFTVQQYLYTTVYHRRTLGEPITLEGWRASGSDADGLYLVEFAYADSQGGHVARWEANLSSASVTAKNETALDLSWH